MNKYLIFRTDRIGDFLVSAILLKCIRINDPSSKIILVASSKNYSYIKKFPYVDDVVKLENGLFSKINVFFKLKTHVYKSVIVHDNKKRSKLISFFLKTNNRIIIKKPNNSSHIDIIKMILNKMNFLFYENSLNILSHNKSKMIKKENFIQLHFDEKWVHKEYIRKFLNIEPTEEQLLKFIKKLLVKSNKRLIITTGFKLPDVLKRILPQIKHLDVKIFENLDFDELEKITSNASILVSCHGAISHVAAANRIKQIDIIDKSYNYSRWTNHFRNYNFLYRDKINFLIDSIIKKL